jgi:TonB-dependent SusC/RagA subfamily outer membrane receptor
MIRHLTGLSILGRLVWKQKSHSHTKPPIIEIPEIQSPFSFFGYVFIDKTSKLSDVEKKLIVAHETAHVEQYHWIDLFLSQIVCALQWFNPFAWLYRNAIRQNHEFLADQSVIRKGYSQAVYHAALINFTLKAPVFALTNAFAYYKFKRITMMKKNVSKPAKKFAVLLLVPALAVFLWAFAKPDYRYSVPTQPNSKIVVSKDTIVVVTDKEPENVIVVGTGSKPLSKKIRKVTNNIQITDSLKGKIVHTYVVQESESDREAALVSPDTSVVVVGYGSIRKPRDGNGGEPLILVDGEMMPPISELEPENIHSFSILKDDAATKAYGIRGENGVILVTTERRANSEHGVRNIFNPVNVLQSDSISFLKIHSNSLTPPLIIVDGEESNASPDKALKNLAIKDIESVTVLKEASATSTYGEKAKGGVIVVKTKK